MSKGTSLSSLPRRSAASINLLTFTQGSQSLALGLAMSAAAQVLE